MTHSLDGMVYFDPLVLVDIDPLEVENIDHWSIFNLV